MTQSSYPKAKFPKVIELEDGSKLGLFSVVEPYRRGGTYAVETAIYARLSPTTVSEKE